MVRTLYSHPKVVPWVLGKPFNVVIGPQAQCEVRMDHVVGPLHILLVEKEGRMWFNIICLKLYQFERTTWWCLYVLEYALQSILLDKYIKKIMVSWNFCQTHLLEVGLMKIPGDHETLSIVCHVELHVDFIHEVFFGPLGLHLRV